jgi:hypothetical protein
MADDKENYDGFDELDELCRSQKLLQNNENTSVLNKDALTKLDTTVRGVDAVGLNRNQNVAAGCSYIAQPIVQNYWGNYSMETVPIVAQPIVQNQILMETVNRGTKRNNESDDYSDFESKKQKFKKLLNLIDGRCPICAQSLKPTSLWAHCKNIHKDFIISTEDLVYDQYKVENFIRDCLSGFLLDTGTLVEMIIFAEKYGYQSVGLAKLDSYMTNLHIDMTKYRAHPIIETELNGTVFVDAKNCHGFESASFCTTKAIDLALERGLGVVLANNAKDLGCAQYFLNKIIMKGLMGLIIANNKAYIAIGEIIYDGSFEDNLFFQSLLIFFNGFSLYNEDKYLFMARNNAFCNLLDEFVQKFNLNTIDKNFQVRNAISLSRNFPPFPAGKKLNIFD